MSYLSVDEMLKRDNINIGFINYYQVQAVNNESKVNIKCVGTFKEDCIPIHKLLEIKHLDYTCFLYSYVISEHDINNDELKMLGFTIVNKNNIIVAFMDFIYNSKNTNIPFYIKLETYNKSKILKSYTHYCGNDKLIYILSSTLVEDNVIQEING